MARATATLKRKDGSTFPAAFTAALLIEPAGGASHLLGVVRDLSDDIRMQEQLVRSERLSAIGELVSGVAHEINNPLQSVIGNLELVMAARHDPAVMEDLERVRWEAARAGRIIRNLLAFVRKSPNERLLADLNEIVQGTVSLRAYELGNTGVELREDYAPNLPLVLVNREEIQQVVLNLVINAQQSMVGRRAARHAHRVRRALSGADAVLEVADDGPGMPPEMAGRVFEPFFTTKGDRRGIRPRPVDRVRHRVGAQRHARARAVRARRLLPPDAARRRLPRPGAYSLELVVYVVSRGRHPQRRPYAHRQVRRILS